MFAPGIWSRCPGTACITLQRTTSCQPSALQPPPPHSTRGALCRKRRHPISERSRGLKSLSRSLCLSLSPQTPVVQPPRYAAKDNNIKRMPGAPLLGTLTTVRVGGRSPRTCSGPALECVLLLLLPSTDKETHNP